MYSCKTVLEFGQCPHPVTSLEFSPDGALIAGAQGRHFTIWDMQRKLLLHKENGDSADNVVAWRWTSDGLTAIFLSGWVTTVRLGAKVFDCIHVDRTGMYKAIAQGGRVSIWSRARGKERWSLQETFNVLSDLQQSPPVAKCIFWNDSPDRSITVIFATHGIITWQLGRDAKSASMNHRPEAEVIVQAHVGLGGGSTALVFQNTQAFRIYDYPACTLTDNFPTSHSPGPMTFARQGTIFIGAVNDTLFLWELHAVNKEKHPVILLHEGE
ncbi:hypothetical protein C8R47DRAFT_1197526 [Mycena vitilis]|nr:hypothetical protein C8R47DRAFT_1197526 [Mycena vitilis]